MRLGREKKKDNTKSKHVSEQTAMSNRQDNADYSTNRDRDRQNYPVRLIENGIKNALKIPIAELRKTVSREDKKDKQQSIPFVITHNPRNHQILNSAKGFLPILHKSEKMKDLVDKSQLIGSRRQAPNLKKLLTRAQFSTQKVAEIQKMRGSQMWNVRNARSGTKDYEGLDSNRREMHVFNTPQDHLEYSHYSTIPADHVFVDPNHTNLKRENTYLEPNHSNLKEDHTYLKIDNTYLEPVNSILTPDNVYLEPGSKSKNDKPPAHPICLYEGTLVAQ
ncbi:Hypothetical predicted protein [Mytilus galloprovincialis]|uniref:Uncharacterized protein n=1 Tax=Mytilus galloprovincialis TaxID=29158 RepID=A0A8B6HQF2_MYTGA|nr:Hypothetical predicted protein [Mytilus galloprovincialis]